MKQGKSQDALLLGLLVSLVISSGCTVSCHLKSSGTSTPGGNSGASSVTITLSDPPTCAASIDHVWVTVTKVAANQSPTAGPLDSGWVTLVDLSGAPQQVDLMSLGSISCVLKQLGPARNVASGTFQELQLFILDNNAAIGPSLNNCGFANGFNCVQPHFGVVQELLLSADVSTGVVFGPSQISGGSITLTPGQSANININFDACASLVIQSNGQYRLKPMLQAGQVSGGGSSISGTVIDKSTNDPIAGAIVLLEQPDANAIDRVVEAGETAADGTFTFCPLATGNYDVVVAAAPVSAATTVYATTIAFQVPAGTPLGNVPMISEGSGTDPSIPWATLSGQVTTAGPAGATAADITFYVIQDAAPSGGAVVHVTIPVFSSHSQPVTETTVPAPFSGPTCLAETNCFNYSLTVPSGNPLVGTFNSVIVPPGNASGGAFNSGSVAYAAIAPGNATYSLLAQTADCSASSPSPAMVNSISVAPATATQLDTVLSFSNCIQPF